MSSSKLLLFKVALQYLFNVFILFNTVSYLKHNYKLKIDPKLCILKNLEEIWKTWKIFLIKRVETLFI